MAVSFLLSWFFFPPLTVSVLIFCFFLVHHSLCCSYRCWLAIVACCYLVAGDLALSWLVKNKLESVENHQQVIIKNYVAHVAELLSALVFQLLPTSTSVTVVIFEFAICCSSKLFFSSVKWISRRCYCKWDLSSKKKKNSLENKNFPSVGVIWWFPNSPLACVCVNVHAVADSRNWAPSAIRCSFRRTYPFNQLLVNSLTNRLLIFQFFNCFKFNNWPGNLHQLGKQFFFEILFHVVIVVILTQSHRRVAFSM